MSQNAGKTVWFIAPALALPFVASVADGFKEAAELVGMKVVIFDGKGQVSEWNKGVEQAVAQGADGINLQSVDPELVSGPLQKAAEAGIAVIDAQNGDPDDPTTPGVFGHATFSFTKSSQLIVDYIIAESDGQANVVLFVDPIFKAQQIRQKATEDEFARLCSGCQLTVQEFDVATMAQQLPQTVQNVLRRQPETGWLIAGFDGQVNFIIQGMRQAGAIGNVRLIGADAVPENLDLIASGEVQEADVGIPLKWQGWAAIDLLGRAMAGEEPLNTEVPNRFFVKNILPRKPTEATEEELFGPADFRAGFKELWEIE